MLKDIARMNERPDEEGIETDGISTLPTAYVVRMNERPDEEGIETALLGSDRAASGMNE